MAPVKQSVVAQRTEDIPVREVMTRDVVGVSPDMSIDGLMAVFLQRNISGAPVVDNRGKAIGTVSKTDVVRDRFDNRDNREARLEGAVQRNGRRFEIGPGYHVEALPEATVADIMTPLSFSLRDNATLGDAAALMAYEGVHRVPVVDATGAVVGIVSALDVLRVFAARGGYSVAPG